LNPADAWSSVIPDGSIVCSFADRCGFELIFCAIGFIVVVEPVPVVVPAVVPVFVVRPFFDDFDPAVVVVVVVDVVFVLVASACGRVADACSCSTSCSVSCSCSTCEDGFIVFDARVVVVVVVVVLVVVIGDVFLWP
jgi:hypothetical protein